MDFPQTSAQTRNPARRLPLSPLFPTLRISLTRSVNHTQSTVTSHRFSFIEVDIQAFGHSPCSAKGDDSRFPRVIRFPTWYSTVPYCFPFVLRSFSSSSSVFLLRLGLTNSPSLSLSFSLSQLVYKSSFGADDRIHDTHISFSLSLSFDS